MVRFETVKVFLGCAFDEKLLLEFGELEHSAEYYSVFLRFVKLMISRQARTSKSCHFLRIESIMKMSPVRPYLAWRKDCFAKDVDFTWSKYVIIRS